METEKSKKAVIGIYDSLAKAEEAELLLEEVHLPVGQMSVLDPNMEAQEVYGRITTREVAETLAASGIHLAEEQLARYRQALNEGKFLLVFRGDANQAVKAFRVMGSSDNDDLKVLDV